MRTASFDQRRTWLLSAGFMAASSLFSSVVSAQTQPSAPAAASAPVAAPAPALNKPIRLVVPYAPGGPIDVTARALAERVKDSLGVVIIDNKPGAGGNLGVDIVAKAPADGYTIGISAVATHAINPWLFNKMPFNAATDFAAITQMVRVPNVLVMNADTAARLKINTLADLIAYGKSNPGKLNYGSGGNGSAGHLAGEMFKQGAGIFAVHIPYNGGNPAQLALLSGQVDFNFDNLATAAPNIRGGKLKALAVTSAERLAALPQVPTATEAGLKGFNLDSWFALYAPAGTPPDIVLQLNSEIARILALPEIRKKAEDAGTLVELMSPQQLGEYTRKELDSWGKVINDAHITAD